MELHRVLGPEQMCIPGTGDQHEWTDSRETKQQSEAVGLFQAGRGAPPWPRHIRTQHQVSLAM